MKVSRFEKGAVSIVAIAGLGVGGSAALARYISVHKGGGERDGSSRKCARKLTAIYSASKEPLASRCDFCDFVKKGRVLHVTDLTIVDRGFSTGGADGHCADWYVCEHFIFAGIFFRRN